MKQVIFLLSLGFVLTCNMQKQAHQIKEFKLSNHTIDNPIMLELEDYLNKEDSLFTLTLINKGNKQTVLKNSKFNACSATAYAFKSPKARVYCCKCDMLSLSKQVF